MIRALALGVAALLLVLVFLSWLSRTSPRNVKRSFGIFLIIVLVIATVILILAGRFAIAIGTIAGAIGIALRTWNAWQLWKRVSGVMGAAGWSGGGRAGQASQASSAWLEMRLDHASGSLDGRVLRGEFKGRLLSDLESPELRQLYESVAGEDADGQRLLEAYLERQLGDDWRAKLGLGAAAGAGPGGGEGEAAGPGGFGAAMGRAEALRILGLEADAGPDEIRAAHRELLSKLHPDRGGSDYLAAKINQAKDLLLGK